MRRVISLGIESGRERQNLGGAELHAKTAGFTALDHDGNTSFGHGTPTSGAFGAPELGRIMNWAYRSTV
jgi:hypothetical protein